MSRKAEQTPLPAARLPLGWLCALAAACVLTLLTARAHLRDEKLVHIELTCTEEGCSASVNGGPALTLESPVSDGVKIGFYTWHRLRPDEPRTYFRNVVIESLDDNQDGRTQYALTTRDGAPALDWIAPGGQPTDSEKAGRWHIEEGRGLTSSATRPGAAVALLEDVEARRFRLTADIVQPLDAGLVFHAQDPRNGTVLVVRPGYNDMFFFPISAGRNGEIQAFQAFRPLQLHREILRVAAVLARILLGTSLLLLLVTVVGRFRTDKTSRAALPDPARLPGRLRLFAVFFSMCAAHAFIACFSLDRIPHITDEIAYLFQAKIFAAGALWAPAPPLPDFFEHFHLIIDGNRWFGKYPPMFSLLLGVGLRAGFPWLVNPVLGGLLAVVLVVLAHDIAGRRAAFFTWLLLITSPLFLFMGGSLMSHTTTALFLCATVLLVVRSMRQNRQHLMVGAGLCWAAAAATRPFTALTALVPIVCYLLCRRTRPGLRTWGYWLIGAFPVLVLLIAWCIAYTTSDGLPMIPNYSYDPSDTLGFGPEKGIGWLMTWGSWGHTPAKGFRSIYAYLVNSLHYVQGWPLGLSFLFVGIPLLFGRRRRPEIFLLFGILAALAAGHFFYWSAQHIAYGARYWFSGLCLMFILSAIGIDFILERLECIGTTARWIVGFFLAALVGWNLLVYLPERLNEGHTYGGVTARLRNEVQRRNLDKAVVFVETQDLLYNDGFFLNDPFLEEPPVFARDLGDRNRELLAHFPGYEAYRWDRLTLRHLEAEADDHTRDNSSR
jgi:hypothetical protein